MSERTAVQLSQGMIDNAARRLTYQRTVVRKLNMDKDVRSSGLAREIEADMQAKLDRLMRSHESLLEGRKPPR